MTLLDKARLIAAMVSRGHNIINATNEANGPRAEELFSEYLGQKKIVLNDLFIGDYRVSQKFGSNPSMYTKYGWKGHNGVDYACPKGTQLVSCVNGKVIGANISKTGWGNHIYIYDESQKIQVIYAHLSVINVKVGQKVRSGQLIGLSGNTGNSTGAHLHFGLYKTNQSGYKTDLGNGFGGAIDPNNKDLVEWRIKNPTKPL